jgi:hypothetical protein
MHITRITRFTRTTRRALALAALFAFALLASAPAASAADEDNRAPELPANICESVKVPAGNKVSSRVYASGVQVYRWSGTAWVFVGPVANLYADHNFRGQIGTHYAGPTWESNSGSKVVARRADGCTPDPSAIAWLKLETVSSEGPGIFDGVTFIQRVNTTGGLAPSTPGTVAGQEARVPYTTEYYFYRAAN